MKKTSNLFDIENEARKEIEFSQRSFPLHHVNVRQIWRYYVGINIGQEISKDAPFKRPCIILGRVPYSSLMLVAPFSTKYHKIKKEYLVPLLGYEKFGLKKSRILLHQITIIDEKRLLHKATNKLGGRNLIKYLLRKYTKFMMHLATY